MILLLYYLSHQVGKWIWTSHFKLKCLLIHYFFLSKIKELNHMAQLSVSVAIIDISKTMLKSSKWTLSSLA